MTKALSIMLMVALAGISEGADLWPSENLMKNPGFEGGVAERVPGWLPQGPGEYAIEGGGRENSQAAKIGNAEGDFLLRSDKVDLPERAKRVSFEVYVKLTDSSPVFAAIDWCSGEKQMKRSKGEPLQGSSDWTLLRVEARVPRRATGFECLVCADGHTGVVLVDEACGRALTKDRPPLRVLCNQVGCDPSLPLRVLVQSRADAPEPGTYCVRDASGKAIREGELIPLGTVPEWEQAYSLVEVEGLAPAEGYRVDVNIAGQPGSSYPFAIGPDIVKRSTLGPAAGFYYYQRCGCKVPGWHEACHMDDARMPDGTHRDLTGGWHDAGDYNKYNSSGYTALSVYALAYAYERAGDILDIHAREKGLPTALEEAVWGADWLLKMQDPETGRMYCNVYSGRLETAAYWGPPEGETDNTPGNDDDRDLSGGYADHNNGNQQAAAALALVGRLTGEKKYAEAALRCYRALADAEKGGADAGGYALLACLELEKAFPGEGFAAEAETLAKQLLTCQIASGPFKGGFANGPNEEIPALWVTSLGLPAAALSLYGQAHGDTLGIAQALEGYLAFSQMLADNPFHISKLVHHGQPVFFLSTHESLWYVGQNSMYSMQAWALTCAGDLTGNRAFHELAVSQIDWVLGRNPLSLCMCEGQGSFNPPQYHHRYNSIPGHPRGAVPGCVCNGICKPQPGPDKPTFDMRTDISRPAWQTNEPWIPHNATYLLAVSSL